jgi:site-specific DNA recombinase
MGGWVPIGYDRKDRTLTVNETEAVTVRTISDLFLKLKNVGRVQAELIRLNLTTKPYETPRGRAIGGLSFARGHIYKILSNPLYIGEIEHRGVRYPGQHPPLIDRQKWDAVQAQLAANHHENRTRTNAKSKSLLAGLIYDDAGNRLVSSHATKNGKRYRYYITSQGNGRSGGTPEPATRRLSATMIDELLRVKLQSFLTDKAQISHLLRENAMSAGGDRNPFFDRQRACGFADVGFADGAKCCRSSGARNRQPHKPNDLHQARPVAGDID